MKALELEQFATKKKKKQEKKIYLEADKSTEWAYVSVGFIY